MLVKVNYLTSSHDFDVNFSWNVLFLKQIVCNYFNIDPSHHKLQFNNVNLIEKEYLQNIPDNSEIFVLPVTNLNHFFVFCYDCEDVKPAKLVSHCNKCNKKQKLPNIIHPNFQSACNEIGCDSKDLKIVRNCSESEHHSSVFLSHFIRNLDNEFSCVACCSIESILYVMFCKDKNHALCYNCFCIYCKEYFDSRLFVYSKDFGYTLECPGGCNSFIADCHHFRILGQDFYSHFKERATEAYLIHNSLIKCPRCAMTWDIEPLYENHQPRIHICQRPYGCGIIFCHICSFYCESVESFTCTCEEVAKQTLSSSSIMVDSKVGPWRIWTRVKLEPNELKCNQLIQLTTKPCPKCKSKTEKDGGCNHIRCLMCSTDWCWICCCNWNYECQENHWY